MELATKTDAQRMMDIFEGYSGSHGVYNGVSDTPDEHGKRIGPDRRTVHSAPTLADFERHLQGVSGLGVVPIRADGTCSWGALDVDDYELDLAGLASRVARLGLPLVPCRSKSGGLHLYLHLSSPAPAKDLIDRLKEYRALLGFGSGVEAFPKQTRLLEGDAGSWLNLPYPGIWEGGRYAINEAGNALTLAEWFALIDERRATPADLKKPLPVSADLPQAPPCIQHLTQIGFSPGSRNNGLLALSTYLKKADPDGWESKADVFNQKYIQPPLSRDEVTGIVRSLRRKDYQYRCSDSPLAQYCNRAACVSRKFGIGSAGNLLRIESISKLDTQPPVFYCQTTNGRVRVTAAQLADPYKFGVAVLEQANAAPALPKTAEWREHIHALLQTAEIIEAPADASEEGAVVAYVQKFCTGRAQAETQAELLLGRPFTVDGRTQFRSIDLVAFLKRQNVAITTQRLWDILRSIGGQALPVKKIKNVCLRIWDIPAFDVQNEPFDLPASVAQGRQDAY
jgi:hypothetical protein